MKKSIFVMGLLMLLTFSVYSSGQKEASQEVSAAPAIQEAMDLTFAYGGPNMGPFAETNQWFCDEVAKRTNAKVNITIHWGGTLVAQPETLSAVGKGVADMGAAMGGPTVTQNPNWSTLSMAGAGQDPWAVMMATYEMVNTNKDIIAEMDAHNVIATHGYFPGTPILVLRKPVSSLKDLKGLRIRVATPDEAAAWASLGAESVALSIPELYDSIDKGVVDGTVLTVGWSDTLRLAEVAPYWYQFSDNLLGGDVTTVINKDVWNKFSVETREIISQIIKQYNDKYTEAVLVLEKKVFKEGLASGAFYYEKVKGEIDTSYTKAINDAHDSWFIKWDEKKGKNTKAVWNEYQKLVKKYQEEVTANGYPWDR